MKNQSVKKSQRGSMLLEALIAILIFSMGILAMVGLQALAISSVSEAKYRSDAAFLTNQIIGEMWVQRANLATTFAYTGGATPAGALGAWVDSVGASLPGVAANPPTISVAGSAAAGFTVTVSVKWRSSNAANASNYTQVAFIRNPD